MKQSSLAFLCNAVALVIICSSATVTIGFKMTSVNFPPPFEVSTIVPVPLFPVHCIVALYECCFSIFLGDCAVPYTNILFKSVFAMLRGIFQPLSLPPSSQLL